MLYLFKKKVKHTRRDIMLWMKEKIIIIIINEYYIITYLSNMYDVHLVTILL